MLFLPEFCVFFGGLGGGISDLLFILFSLDSSGISKSFIDKLFIFFDSGSSSLIVLLLLILLLVLLLILLSPKATSED